jgi:hypothetical protein
MRAGTTIDDMMKDIFPYVMIEELKGCSKDAERRIQAKRFYLNRSYEPLHLRSLHNHIWQNDLAKLFHENQVQIWESWFPSCDGQIPEQFREFRYARDWHAMWIPDWQDMSDELLCQLIQHLRYEDGIKETI